MRADNSHLVIAAARRRARRPPQACGRVTAPNGQSPDGQSLSMRSAREATVSRSWLYNQPDLRAEIERLRGRPRSGHTRPAGLPIGNAPPTPHSCGGSTAATDRIKHLEAENHQLRDALAIALGEQRSANVHGSLRDTPNRKSAAIIGPC